MTMTAGERDTTHSTAAAALQRLVPELVALTLIAKQCHWNVRGPAFLPLHDLTEELAIDTRNWTDRVAERATALGYSVDGRPVRVAAATSEFANGWLADSDVIRLLAGTIDVVAGIVRADIDRVESSDPVAHDIQVDVLEGLEKYAWLLRSGAAVD